MLFLLLPAGTLPPEPIKVNMVQEIRHTDKVLQKDYKSSAYRYLEKEDSPLKDYVDELFDAAPNNEAAVLAIAVSGKESSFGKYKPAWSGKNLWGIMCWKPERYVCNFNSWKESFDAVFNTKTGYYYNNFDGTKESFKTLFEGRYCTEGCDGYINYVWSIYLTIY